MLEEHAKLMTFFSQAGEVIGRKKLQKMIYILKKLNVPFGEKFTFHVYGPYSEELSLRMEELTNLGLIEELKEDKGHYYHYRYSLSDEGTRFLKLSMINLPDLTDVTGDLNQQSSRFLELLSTLLYFDHLSGEELKQKVMSVKPKQKYTNEEFEKAIHYMSQLKNYVVQ
ncbi:YwgA family protein [Alkalicoccobacillus porphyridii]|uniref:YwgA family protein n=1 Tax=Alkalicoccobacillus porphyridii TaxID=2597270 RepID=A0A553ZUG9_9BACI|nr:YwgA family protein [Alkalicoccobacillus porphyridii]TSB44975.1 YwgA family protein [Alkalicoccobacillus porphyridii]